MKVYFSKYDFHRALEEDNWYCLNWYSSFNTLQVIVFSTLFVFEKGATYIPILLQAILVMCISSFSNDTKLFFHTISAYKVTQEYSKITFSQWYDKLQQFAGIRMLWNA